MVDPGRGKRCAIRDTRASGPGRYHWTVTVFGETDPVGEENWGARAGSITSSDGPPRLRKPALRG
jgi:hypothetical protein